MKSSNENNPTRSLFVENFKKNRSNFISKLCKQIKIDVSLGNLINVDDILEKINLIEFCSNNLNSPAMMWDAVDQKDLELLWNALTLCLNDNISDLTEKSNEIVSIIQEMKKYKKDELNKIVDNDAKDDNVDEDYDDDDDDDDDYDDDEDDDDDEASFPNQVYHATDICNLPSILNTGIIPINKKFAYAYESKSQAVKKASKRYGESSHLILFTINLEMMLGDDDLDTGIYLKDFGHGDGVVYLFDRIDPKYLTYIDLENN
jgi:hypothetical protein